MVGINKLCCPTEAKIEIVDDRLIVTLNEEAIPKSNSSSYESTNCCLIKTICTHINLIKSIEKDISL